MDNPMNAAQGVRRGFLPERGRVAVSLLFLMNGFVVGCWVSEDFRISPSVWN